MQIFAPLVKPLNADVNECSLSVSTLRRNRIKNRDPEVKKMLNEMTRMELIHFIQQRKLKYKRKDYQEFLDLALIFFGMDVINGKAYIFRPPNAHHHARWMAKVIYALKMYLFRKEFCSGTFLCVIISTRISNLILFFLQVCYLT